MARINKKFRGHRQDDLVTNESFSITRQMYEESNRTQSELANETVKSISLDRIKTHEDNIFNYRDRENNSEGIKELADNIEREGLVHNIAVTQRPGESEYVILSGERRYKAFRYLNEKYISSGNMETAKKYRRIPCRIIDIKVDDENLRRNAEQIYIDSANAFTREGISDSDLFEKVAVRYVKNLSAVYGMSGKDARRSLIYHLNEASGQDKTRKVDRSLEIYKKLIPEMYDFYRGNDRDMPRDTAKRISALSPDEQKLVYDSLNSLSKDKNVLGSAYPLIYSDFQKKVIARANDSENKNIEKLCRDLASKVNSTKSATAKINQNKNVHTGADAVYTKNYDTVVKAKNIIQKLNKKAIVLSMKDAHRKKSEKDVLPEIDAMIRLLNTLRAEIEE